MRKSQVVLAALAMAVVASGLFAEDAPQPDAPPADPAALKAAKARRLLKAQGAEANAKVAFDGMIQQIEDMPGLPPGFIKAFKERMKLSELVDVSVPILVKHLDDATLDAAIAFYETPAGAKFVAAQPAITTDTMTAGAELGRKIAVEVMADLAKRESEK